MSERGTALDPGEVVSGARILAPFQAGARAGGRCRNDEMILWPVIGRELRVAARHPPTGRTRLAAGLVATMLLAWANLVCSWRGASQAGLEQTLFNTLSGMAFLYCLMTGACVTADCISR